MDTFDDLTKDTTFRKSEFIKLDVQGYEIEVLKGARLALEFVEVILMEISLIALVRGAPSLFVKETSQLGAISRGWK